MIISFGYICMELEMTLSERLIFPSIIKSSNSSLTIGGSAANQIIAAARCGAKTSLIGAIGNDVFGKTILDKLRHEGIRTSAITKKDSSTSIINSITDMSYQKASIIVDGANSEISAAQIPDNSLNEKTLILLQNDISLDININILKRAKSGGAKSVICIEHENNADPSLFNYADIVIINNDTVSKQTNKNTIIVEYKNRAFDTFCGSFAACVQAGMNISRAIEHGHSAAKTYISSNDFPYLDDVIKNLKH